MSKTPAILENERKTFTLKVRLKFCAFEMKYYVSLDESTLNFSKTED
jgi:hypothetical protein